MTVEEGHRLNPQAGSEGVAEGDFPLRIGDCRRDGGEQRRQFRLEAGAAGLRRRAVTTMLEPVAVAGLAAATSPPPAFAGDGRKRPASYGHLPHLMRFAHMGEGGRYSNHMNFSTPSLLGARLDPECAVCILHSGRIQKVGSMLISAGRRNAIIPWVALWKINSTARG